MNTLQKHTGIGIFVFSLFLLIITQFVSINPLEQDRFFYFSLDMIQRGPTFFPYVDGAPYPDYIAMVMVMSDLVSRLFGHVSVFSVGLPYCLAGALLVTYTYRLGALHDKQLGVLGAFFCLMSWKFLDGMSALDLDIFPALSTVICVYLTHKAHLSKQKVPFLRCILLWLFGFFCRGPIGLLIPAMITGLYYFTQREWKISFQIAIFSIFLFISTYTFLVFMAYRTGGETFMREVMGQQGFGRLVNEHAARYYFFFTIGLLDYAFTSLFAVMVGMHYWKALFETRFTDSSKKLLIFSMQWSIVIILFFTLPATKKARYIMPMVPAIALMSAYPFILEELNNIKKRILFILKNLPFLNILIALISMIFPLQIAAYGLLFVGIVSVLLQCFFASTRFYKISMGVIALTQMFALHLMVIEPITLHSLARTSFVPWF